MTRCKNCMRTLALALTLVLSLSISVPARAAVDETNAHRLNALGLFLGTGSGYDLGGSAHPFAWHHYADPYAWRGSGRTGL